MQQQAVQSQAPSSSRKLGSHLPAQTGKQRLSHARGLQRTEGQDLLLAGCACFPPFVLPPNPLSALLCLALGLSHLTCAALPSTSCCGQSIGNMQVTGRQKREVGKLLLCPSLCWLCGDDNGRPLFSVITARPSLPSPQARRVGAVSSLWD